MTRNQIIIVLIMLLCGFGNALANNNINGLRFWDSPTTTRIIVDLEKAPKYDVFQLNSPNRIVVDLNHTKLRGKLPSVDVKHPNIKEIRGAKRKNRAHRIVVDTKSKVNYRAYTLKPNQTYGHRLVIELENKQRIKKKAINPSSQKTFKQNGYRDVVIAIDAGHGGEDPGASGRRGTREKDVTLRIAKKLKKHVDNYPGMRAVLIRQGDYYIPLRKRIKKARDAKADLFISIHADAYKNPRVKGSSVFVLSERGASDEAAKWLAHKENSADLIGGVSIHDKEDTLARVLLDLSQTHTIDASARAASKVLAEIDNIGPTHNKTVQHARFVVLKSPDIPSMLVETAFISNPQEELRLRKNAYQNKLAKAMLKGIAKYFKSSPPPNTKFANNNKSIQVRTGETLTQIARRHNVSLKDLMRVNGLRSDNLYSGQNLKLPF